MIRLATLGLAAAVAALASLPNLNAQGEITRSGSTWSARVNGNTVYTGNRMFDAVNAAIDNMSSGTVNIRNSGDSGPDGGNVYAIRPKANMTLDFHGHTVNANGGDLIIPVYADRRNNIAVRNLRVTGNPRYGLWFRGCSGVTLHNITMDLSNNSPVGLGIRVDASTGPASNLTISGNIDIDGSAGHAVETYGIDGFTIGDITATNTGGCGLLLNDSRNGTVGNVVGHYNNNGGGYATFRVANGNGPNVTVESVYSRNSGRGFFSVSDSHGTTVNNVDIANTTSHGIFLEDAWDTHVLSGSVSNGNPNCQEVRTSNTTINVAGCGGSGGGGGGGLPDGTYRLRNRASGKYLDNLGSTANGAGVGQWASSSSNNQRWVLSTTGSYRKLMCVTGNMYLDSMGRSSDGSEVGQWSNSSSYNQQWTLEHVSGNYYRIINRANGKAVDTGAQNGDGAIMQHWYVNSSYNQQWELVAD